MDNKVLDEAVEVAVRTFRSDMSIDGNGCVGPHTKMRAALLAGMRVLLGEARLAIMDVDAERVAIVDRHDDCPSHGFQNVWIVDAPSLGEGDGR